MLAVYDLSSAPPTWDFATWLIRAEIERVHRGADRLRVALRKNPSGDGFRADGLPPPLDERRFMLGHIVRPLVHLIGAEAADGDTSAASTSAASTSAASTSAASTSATSTSAASRFDYMTAGIVEAARAGAQIPMFRPGAYARALTGQWCGQNYITITLREAAYWPVRNSRTGEWLRVARELESRNCRVIVVRDTAFADEPLPGFRTAPWASVDVELRCALYAGAGLNLGVCNGPMTLAMYGPAPYLLFKQIVPGSITQNEHFLRASIGIGPGEQLPWATPRQRWAWADDTFDEIMAAIIAL